MIISVLVEASLAELEWIMPVCWEIKKREKSAKIYLLFLVFDKNKIVKSNKFMMTLMDEIFDGYYDLQDCICSGLPGLSYLINKVKKLKKTLYNRKDNHSSYSKSQMIADTNGAAIRKEGNGNLFILNKILSSLKLFVAKVLRWIGSETIPFLLCRFIHNNRSVVLLKPTRWKQHRAVDRAVDILRAKGLRTVGYPDCSRLHGVLHPPRNEDLILFNTDEHKAQATACEDIKGALVTVGVPRYDNHWISYLISKFDHGRKYLPQNPKGKVFLVNLQKEYAWIFSLKKFETYLDEILDVLSTYKNAAIILKPHPNQNLNSLEHRIVSRKMHECVHISHSSSLALAAVSDLIITMPSTSIFDLITSGKPVVEYYDYELFKEYPQLGAEKNELSAFEKNISGSPWLTYSEKSGRPTSIYQSLRFVKGVSSQQSLETVVGDLVNVQELDRIKHFRKYFPPDATARAATEVLRIMT